MSRLLSENQPYIGYLDYLYCSRSSRVKVLQVKVCGNHECYPTEKQLALQSQGLEVDIPVTT